MNVYSIAICSDTHCVWRNFLPPTLAALHTCSISLHLPSTLDDGIRKHEKRIVIIALHGCGQSQREIVILLKPLGINRLSVFHVVKWCNKMGDIVDRPKEGRPHSVCLAYVIHAVCKMKSTTQTETNGSGKERVNAKHRCILCNNLKLSAYRCCVSHTFTSRLREILRTRCALFCKRFKVKKLLKYPLQRREDFFNPGKIESLEWLSVRTELLRSQGEDAISHTHAPSFICDGLVGCVVSWHYPNSLLRAGGKNW